MSLSSSLKFTACLQCDYSFKQLWILSKASRVTLKIKSKFVIPLIKKTQHVVRTNKDLCNGWLGCRALT